jgi:hypothetical protein
VDLSNSDAVTAEFSSLKADLLVGWVSSVVFVILWAFLFVKYIFYDLISSGLVSAIGGANLSSRYFLGYFAAGVFFLVWMIPAIVTMRRIGSMYKAALNQDIARLKEVNSQSWAIVALVFAGALPGIMLLTAFRPINELPAAGLAQVSVQEADSIEKLSKLKVMLDSGLITRAEFDSQKNLVLHPSAPTASGGSVEAQLAKLKSLYESGAITKDEYDQQRQALLNLL